MWHNANALSRRISAKSQDGSLAQSELLQPVQMPNKDVLDDFLQGLQHWEIDVCLVSYIYVSNRFFPLLEGDPCSSLLAMRFQR